MQLHPAEISELIKDRIENLHLEDNVKTKGTVISATDGIVRIYGLSNAMLGEMIQFKDNTFGLAMNLEQDSVAVSYTHL